MKNTAILVLLSLLFPIISCSQKEPQFDELSSCPIYSNDENLDFDYEIFPCLSKLVRVNTTEDFTYNDDDIAEVSSYGYDVVRIKNDAEILKLVSFPLKIKAIRIDRKVDLSKINFGNFPNIEFLFIETQGTEIPQDISKLEKLKVFHLKSSTLSEMPDVFANFHDLEVFSLDLGRSAHGLPNSMFELKNIKELKFYNCTGTLSVPIDYRLFPKLEKLSIRESDDFFLNETLTEASKLKVLQVSQYSEVISNIPSLKTLNIDYCEEKINCIYHGLSKLKNLEELTIGIENQQTITEISKLRNLRNLTISVWEVEEDSLIKLGGLRNLEYLQVYSNFTDCNGLRS